MQSCPYGEPPENEMQQCALYKTWAEMTGHVWEVLTDQQLLGAEKCKNESWGFFFLWESYIANWHPNAPNSGKYFF